MWSKKELIDKQARFWVLMSKGSTLQAAGDAVGVNRRTGRHWRQVTGGQVPRKKPEPSGRYLSLDDRLQIADLVLAGVGVRAIATQRVGLGAHQGVDERLEHASQQVGLGALEVLGQELGRVNTVVRGHRVDLPQVDFELSSEGSRGGRLTSRRHAARRGRRTPRPWTQLALPDRQEMQVSPETIYQALYVKLPSAVVEQRSTATGAHSRLSPSRRNASRVAAELACA